MKFTIQREALLKPLQMVSGAVEKRHTLPILANVLLHVKTHQLSVTATDMEIELEGYVTLTEPAEAGKITVPARKLLDICRTAPDKAILEISCSENYVQIKTGKSRFSVIPLPADEFPSLEQQVSKTEFDLSQSQLLYLLECTHFSMGEKDSRYYLNGLSLQFEENQLRTVATNGHRLATATVSAQLPNATNQIIIPRKGVLELIKQLSDEDEKLAISITENNIRVAANDFILTSKLIDATYPDYNKVIPLGGDKQVIINKNVLKDALVRVSILSNEKHRGVRLQLTQGRLLIAANNPDQEEAEEELDIDYHNEELIIGFNVSYMLDVLSNLTANDVRLTFKDSNSSLLIESADSDRVLYVIMPMRL